MYQCCAVALQSPGAEQGLIAGMRGYADVASQPTRRRRNCHDVDMENPAKFPDLTFHS